MCLAGRNGHDTIGWVFGEGVSIVRKQSSAARGKLVLCVLFDIEQQSACGLKWSMVDRSPSYAYETVNSAPMQLCIPA
jgi:hypothetical protein